MHPSYSASFPYCSESAVQRCLGNLIDSYMNSTATTTTMMKRKKDWFILKLAIRKQDIFCVKKNSLFLWKYNMYMDHENDEFLCDALYMKYIYILFVNNKNSCQNAFLFRHESQFFLMIFPWFFLTSCFFPCFCSGSQHLNNASFVIKLKKGSDLGPLSKTRSVLLEWLFLVSNSSQFSYMFFFMFIPCTSLFFTIKSLVRNDEVLMR